MRLTEEQALIIGRMVYEPFLFLEYVKIQEPGDLRVDYELWGHLVNFYKAIEEHKLIDLIKSKQIGVCLDPSTLVLTADLRWVLLNDIREGDTLISVDEFPKEGKGQKRHLRKCSVLAKSEVEKPAYLIKTTKGDIIATKEHRFLASSPNRWSNKWRSISKAERIDGRLRPGYKIRMITEPWGEATYEDGWFGGMIDGEGCLRGGEKRTGVELVIAQLPGAVLDRGERYLTKYSYYRKTQELTKTSLGHKVDRLELYNLFQLFEIIGKCRPSRFVDDSSWWDGKALGGNKVGAGYGEILSIKPLGMRRMIDLMTSTGTFIANGFVSHNSWALAIHALRKIYTIPGWNVLEFSKGMVEAQELLAKSKIVYHNFPDWMKQLTLEPNSTEKFGFKELKSKITAFPSTETAGIGETAGTVIHDESDFHEFYETNLSHTRATVADSPDRQLISVSTVDKTKPDSYFKRHWKAARDGQNGFKALFYGRDTRPDRDDNFYRLMEIENTSTPWVVEANYPRTAEEALSPLSVQSCFNADKLKILWNNAVDPETRQGFIYILYPPRVGTLYVAGADVGEGVGLDYSCLTIIGKEGLNSEVVAVIYTNTLATDLFAYESDKLCREYFDCLLAVENNSLGVAVTNKLLELNYPNLYYSDKEKKKVGWNTGDRSKHTATTELVQVVDNGSLVTKFKPQIKEMMEYQWVAKNNVYKPLPTGKTHGDTVISLMIANQMLKNVRERQKARAFANGVQIW